MRPGGTTVRDIVARLDELILAVDALLRTDTVHALRDLAEQLGIGGALAAAFSGLIAALQQIDAWLGQLEDPLARAAQYAGAIQPIAGALKSLGESAQQESFGAKDLAIEVLGGATTVVTAAANILGGLPRYADEVVPVRDALTTLIGTCEQLRDSAVPTP